MFLIPELAAILDLHAAEIASSGGMAGVRDMGALQSAMAQPLMTFGGQSRGNGIFAD